MFHATQGRRRCGRRWRVFPIDQLLAWDKVNLDIFWLRDESLEDSANLPDPDVIAAKCHSFEHGIDNVCYT